jgi:NAD+ synthase (glutamine-hydrolysing)
MRRQTINQLNFLSVTLISPAIQIGNVKYNKDIIISEMRKFSDKTDLLVFPELCLTGATCGDLLFDDDFIRGINNAINDIVEETYNTHSTVILGTALKVNNRLLDVALFLADGKLLGIVPKDVNTRWFQSSDVPNIMFHGYDVPVSNRVTFRSFCDISVCVGADSPGRIIGLDNADVVVCIDASPYVFSNNKISDYIRTLSTLSEQAILYVNANPNESSTDAIYGAEILVSECGQLVANNEDLNELGNDETGLSFDTRYCSADIDIDLIRGNRKLSNKHHKVESQVVKFDFVDKNINEIQRYAKNGGIVKPFYKDPFNTELISNDASVALHLINVQGVALARRIKHIGVQSAVVGVSSGVDSTLALLATCRCFDILGLDKKDIYAISLPGLGTSNDSNDIAQKMANSLGVHYDVISISDAVNQHFSDIKYDAAKRDVVYENAQARMRSLVLFDFANKVNGIVVGTGDLSEIALGWSTYNGDHISNYNVNAGIPKSVAQAILRSLASSKVFPQLDAMQLERVLGKPISPELLPTDSDGKVQATEEILGPYELHDFFIFYYLKYFLSKAKLLYIANYTFGEKYTEQEIEQCLNTFFKRFRINQYKRSCSADGPSIFGISLSPRGGLVLPSDM